MKLSRRRKLLPANEASFVLNGLCSGSIKEAPVSITLNGKIVGSFQGLEVYEKVANQDAFPQTVADVVSNLYVRLSYQKEGGTSGTFGTSVVTAASFRTHDSKLHYIPQVTKVTVDTSERLKVNILASYNDIAQVSSTRTYTLPAGISETKTVVEIRFVALKDIYVDQSQRGKDVFRLLTISSMYASPDCYDGNVIQSKGLKDTISLKLTSSQKRGVYLFNAFPGVESFALVKEIGSMGALQRPGSSDSPSIQCEVLDSSLPATELGIQAYLDHSRNWNDDSLSVWLEWLKCPKVIPMNTEIWAKVQLTALPPRGDKCGGLW